MVFDGPVAWRVAVPPEVTTEYAGTRLGAYYTDTPTMLATQQRGREAFLARYGIDIGSAGRVDPPAYVGSAALGAELVIPDDDPPMIRSHPLKTTEECDRVRLPESYFDTRWAAFYDWMRVEMQKLVGPGHKVRMGHGLEGPITTAKLLRGEGFFLDLYDDPRRAHVLLDRVTESIIRFGRDVRRRNGDPLDGGVGIADDFAGLISPAMWGEFVVPYYARIYEAFGGKGRALHSELLRRDHLRFLADLGVTHFDPGQDQYLSLRDILTAVSMPVSWNLFTVRDMLQGTPKSIETLYRQAVRDGAREIMAELCRGTPPENIEAFISIAREYAPE